MATSELCALSYTPAVSSTSSVLSKTPRFFRTVSCGRRFKMHRRSLNAEPEACRSRAARSNAHVDGDARASISAWTFYGRLHSATDTTRQRNGMLPEGLARIGTSWPDEYKKSAASRCDIARQSSSNRHRCMEDEDEVVLYSTTFCPKVGNMLEIRI